MIGHKRNMHFFITGMGTFHHLVSRKVAVLFLGFVNLCQPFFADCEEHQAGTTDDHQTFQQRPSRPVVLGEQKELSSLMSNKLEPAFKPDGLWLLRAVA